MSEKLSIAPPLLVKQGASGVWIEDQTGLMIMDVNRLLLSENEGDLVRLVEVMAAETNRYFEERQNERERLEGKSKQSESGAAS